ncbi:MAG TPA: Hsp20/alpha crystallin family protein [Polyangiaceae bacterium]
MLDDVMGSMVGTALTTRNFTPHIDIRSNDDQVTFVCDVPGVKEEDLEVMLENRTLTIKGVRRFERADRERVLLGRAYGSFERSFELPDYLDDSQLVAHLADGVLTIRIPKAARAKPKRIPLVGGSGSGNRLKGGT